MSEHHRPLQGTPLTNLTLDEGKRPSAPAIEGLSSEQKRTGRQLAIIHRHHRMELSKARAVLRHIIEGKDNPSAFLAVLEGMDLVQNFQLFGNLCGRECQMLNFHHDIEEQSTFPHLARNGSDGLRKVIAKLQQEHLVVHELLLRLQDAAVALINDPGQENFDQAVAVFDKLETVIMSHFGYEEDELAEAIGKFGLGH